MVGKCIVYVLRGLRIQKVELKLEALAIGVLFNNFAKFTVKHLCWSLFLIKLNLFCRTFPNGCLSEMNQKNCIRKIYSQENTTDGILFNAAADIWAYKLSKKGPHHRCFSMKIGKFYSASILQNNAARLLLISCDIINVLLALSVIAWRYNINIVSVIISVLISVLHYIISY